MMVLKIKFLCQNECTMIMHYVEQHTTHEAEGENDDRTKSYGLKEPKIEHGSSFFFFFFITSNYRLQQRVPGSSDKVNECIAFMRVKFEGPSR